METPNPHFIIQSRAMLLAAACLIGPVTVSRTAHAADLADVELSRRSADVQEAQELLRKGDEAYLAGRYDEAVEAFGGARELIPDAPVSKELRNAATERYAQASVEKARVLSRKGDVAGAKAAVDRILRDDVAPADPGALAMRAQLDDPIRTNPALTAEHAADVDQVRRLLYTAEGAYDLGKFDEAKTHFEKVLGIDPTNSAARRGMERVAAAKSGYHQASFDSTRAEMLGMVEAAWETPLSVPEFVVAPEGPGDLPGMTGEETVAAKIERIMVPRISLDQATLGDAIEFLRAASVKEDTLTANPDQRGVNFTINLGAPDSEVAKRIYSQKFDLQLSQVPLSRALKYITEITRTSFSTDDFAVNIRPLGTVSDELFTRDYRVPPDFLTSMTNIAGAPVTNPDPFAENSGQEGLLTQLLSAQEALSKQGIPFPEGAMASYSPASNILHVVNTAINQDIISQIVQSLTQTEPVAVSVQVTMIKVQESDLKELGYDWLLNPVTLADDLFLGGGTAGSSLGRKSSDFANTIPLPADPSATVNPGVVTNGLRSGNQAFTTNTLEGLLANPNRDGQTTAIAPGILSVTGLFEDGQAQAVMRGLNQKKGVDLMARPSILTRSGQSSNILIAREFIYPTEYEPPELPNSVGTSGDQGFPVTPATPTAFETKEVGISLEVLPVADADKRYVDITLNPSIVDFDGFINYGSPIKTTVTGLLGTSQVNLTDNAILMPVFSSQKTSTQLTVADGATIVIGGLMRDSIQTVEDKVPVLGDIPFVGRFFSTSAQKPVSTAVIFLVRVELLDPTGRPYRDR